jgi:hypothetical protein
MAERPTEPQVNLSALMLVTPMKAPLGPLLDRDD